MIRQAVCHVDRVIEVGSDFIPYEEDGVDRQGTGVSHVPLHRVVMINLPQGTGDAGAEPDAE